VSAAEISQQIAKKNYAKAIDLIKAQLKAGKHNPQLHLQLADVLILAKKEKEAIQILMRTADEFAAEGWEAKAIAVLKKIDRIDPGRRDVQAKLASFVKRPPVSAAPPPPAARGGELELGMEEIGFAPTSAPVSAPAPAPAPPPPPPPAKELELPSFAPTEAPAQLNLGDVTMPAIDVGFGAPRTTPAAPRPAPPPAPVQDFDFGEEEESLDEAPPLELLPTDDAAAVEVSDIELEPEPEGAPAAAGSEPTIDDTFAQDLMSAIDEAFEAPPATAAGSQQKPGEGAVRGDFMSSPLFKGFAPDELVAILEGLTLHSFEAGEIILTQGAPGHSLFILSTGMVRAYVKDEHGVYRFARDLEEGSFFGEFAILTGQPRAATVTAATHCELLELDRGTLDAISIAHPHVQEVLRQFYEERLRTQGG
jgi:hypothetical protein